LQAVFLTFVRLVVDMKEFQQRSTHLSIYYVKRIFKMIMKVLFIFVMSIYSLLIKNQISFISGLLNLNNINNHLVSSPKTLTVYIQMPEVHTPMNYMVH